MILYKNKLLQTNKQMSKVTKQISKTSKKKSITHIEKDKVIKSLQNELSDLKSSHVDIIIEYEKKIQELNNNHNFKLKFFEEKLLNGKTEKFIEYYHKLIKLLDSIDELRILYLM